MEIKKTQQITSKLCRIFGPIRPRILGPIRRCFGPYSTLFQISCFKLSDFQICILTFSKFKTTFRFLKFGTWVFHFQNFRFSDMKICSKDVLTIIRWFLTHFSDEYGVRGTRFGYICGRSKNVPKNIATDQESLISHWGIIKTP